MAIWQAYAYISAPKDTAKRSESHLCKTAVFLVSNTVNLIGSIIFFIVVILVKKSMNNIVVKSQKKMVSLYGEDDEKSQKALAATKKAVDSAICNLRAVVYPICIVTLYSFGWSIAAFSNLANESCFFDHETQTGASFFSFFSASIINVWWVIPVIVVYWPVGKCGSDKSKTDRERSRSRAASN